jgi:hypothetical protein
MSNKYLKYFLLIGTVIVWGIIGFRILSGFGSIQKPIPIKSDTEKIIFPMEEDTLTIQADYSDPFIPEPDSLTDPDSKSNEIKKMSHPIDSTKLKPDYSFIKYVGLISGSSKKSRVAIINFRGDDLMMKETDKIQGFTLKSIAKKELTFISNGISFQIKRE